MRNFLILLFAFLLINKVSGQSNQVLALDGLTSYVSVPDNAALDLTNNFTVEAWVKTCDTSLNQLIVEKKWCSGADNSFYFAIIKGKLRWLWDNDGYCANQPSSYMTTDNVILPNVWTHCAAVHTADSVSIFVNGVKVAGYLEGGQYSAVYQSMSPLRIGAYRALAGNYGMFFKGYIDDVRIWNTTRTASEIAGKMNSTLTGSETNLVACYDMETSGSGQNITVQNKSAATGSPLDGLTVGSSSYPAFVNETVSFGGCASIPSCTKLEIDISSTRRRRCFRNNTIVTYRNAGTLHASNVVVTVTYPKYVTPLSSSVPWTSKADSLLTFNIGTLNAQQTGTITIVDSVSCITGITGFTECTEATISPLNNCSPVNTAWDKSSIAVSGFCNNDKASFYIINKGSGDMGTPSQYRVYFDDTLGYTSPFMQASGDTLVVNIDAYGQTIRLEADQHPLHPGHSHPRATVEGCGIADLSLASRGFVNTAPKDDQDFEKAISCLLIVDSYDPNDKEVFPAGLTSSNYIKPGTDLEYLINFQNTGTDTAYTVVIRDTISSYLDVSTFSLGASSHNVTVAVTEKGMGILTFTFNNINLPDSNVNQLKSQGFVQFKIKQKANLPKDTRINNQAHIYFDFNSPVGTNVTMNTVHDTIIFAADRSARIQVIQAVTGFHQKTSSAGLSVVPNPFNESTIFTYDGGNTAESRILYLYDSNGNLVSENAFNGNSVVLKRKKLPAGIYFYKISEKNVEKSQGKVIITD